MLKELKYVVYLLTIFFFIFIVIKFYLSEDNIKWNNKVIIQYQNIFLDVNPNNYDYIPLSLVKKCTPYIKTYLNKLNEMYVYYVNEKYNSGFLYHKDIIINIIYLCFVQDYDSLIQQQLLLMKQYNFTYQDFNNITINSINAYVKIINLKLNKDD